MAGLPDSTQEDQITVHLLGLGKSASQQVSLGRLAFVVVTVISFYLSKASSLSGTIAGSFLSLLHDPTKDGFKPPCNR